MQVHYTSAKYLKPGHCTVGAFSPIDAFMQSMSTIVGTLPDQWALCVAIRSTNKDAVRALLDASPGAPTAIPLLVRWGCFQSNVFDFVEGSQTLQFEAQALGISVHPDSP